MTPAGLARLEQAWARGMTPEPQLSVWEWADRHRHLSSAAGTKEAGMWSTDRVPYMRAIMEALSPHAPYRKVNFAKGSQIAATETALCWAGYHIHHQPQSMLIIWPTTEMAEENAKTKLQTGLIDATPVLRALVQDARARDSGNTILRKSYPGGTIRAGGANSKAAIRSGVYPRVYIDEVDACEGNPEGDIVLLAERACATYGDAAKLFITSTPLLEGTSRIWRLMQNSDIQVRYHVPCPGCGLLQELTWDRMRWTETIVAADRPPLVTDVFYACLGCDYRIQNHEKERMLPDEAMGGRAKWVATYDNGRRDAIGFHLSGLYSPVGWRSWEEIVGMWTKAIYERDQSQQQVVWNTAIGLPWAAPTERPEWRTLRDRRERYPIGTVPAGRGACLLFCGADVQVDRIEAEVIAVGRGMETWSVDYPIIKGDPQRPEVYEQFEREVLFRDWPCEGGGTLPIRVNFIDANYLTTQVSGWARRHPQARHGPAGVYARTPRTVVAGMGRDWWDDWFHQPKKQAGERTKHGLHLWNVGASFIKVQLYGWLGLQGPTDEEFARGAMYPPGFLHFPEYGDEWFKQLVSEKLARKLVGGEWRRQWQRDGATRAEALDCRVYALAAMAIFGVHRFTEKNWAYWERQAPPSLRRHAPVAVLPPPAGRPEPDDPTPNPPPPPEPSSPSPAAPSPTGSRPRRRSIASPWMAKYR